MNQFGLPLKVLGWLLAVTGLGWAAEVPTEQAKAVAAITKLGGKVTVDEKSPGKPVIEVDLMDTQVTDAGLGHLAMFPHLQSLNLYNTKVTDAGLEHVKPEQSSPTGSFAIQGNRRGRKETPAGSSSLSCLALNGEGNRSCGPWRLQRLCRAGLNHNLNHKDHEDHEEAALCSWWSLWLVFSPCRQNGSTSR